MEDLIHTKQLCPLGDSAHDHSFGMLAMLHSCPKENSSAYSPLVREGMGKRERV